MPRRLLSIDEPAIAGDASPHEAAKIWLETRRQAQTYLDTLRGRAKYGSSGFARALGSVEISIGRLGLLVHAWEMKTLNDFVSLRFKHAQRGLEADYGPLGWI